MVTVMEPVEAVDEFTEEDDEPITLGLLLWCAEMYPEVPDVDRD